MREIVKQNGDLWIQETNLINKVSRKDLEDDVARLTAQKAASLAQQTAHFDTSITEAEGLIAQYDELSA